MDLRFPQRSLWRVIMGCEAVTFRRNILTPSSASESKPSIQPASIRALRHIPGDSSIHLNLRISLSRYSVSLKHTLHSHTLQFSWQPHHGAGSMLGSSDRRAIYTELAAIKTWQCVALPIAVFHSYRWVYATVDISTRCLKTDTLR
jgi:hypothetical protein